MNFIKEQLYNSEIDAVLVFGGPPCQSYSQWTNAVDKAATKEEKARMTYQKAISDYSKARKQDLDIAAAESILEEAHSGWQNAVEDTLATQKRHDTKLLGSDKLVRDFINLFMRIEGECKSLRPECPCFLIMENPKSSENRALWNR